MTKNDNMEDILKPTQEQIDRVAELFIKMTDGKITEKQYMKAVKENAKKVVPNKSEPHNKWVCPYLKSVSCMTLTDAMCIDCEHYKGEL